MKLYTIVLYNLSAYAVSCLSSFLSILASNDFASMRISFGEDLAPIKFYTILLF